MTNATTSPLLTLKEVAAYVGVSTRTITRWMEKGKISLIKLPGGLRMKKENLDRWLEKRVKQTS